MMSRNVRGAALLAAVLVPWLAPASVGTVSKLDGSATRTPKDGKAIELSMGDDVELDDTLRVSANGNLKLTLADRSVVMLAGGSELRLDEGRFENGDRKGFAAFLKVGKFWASVKKALAGSDAKFEVTTERAVAGVRGTIFRVDALSAMKATSPASGKKKPKPVVATVVRVEEGKVAVTAEVRKPRPPVAQVKPGERRQVAGPREISSDEWEKRFVELQQGQQVVVGLDLWEEGQVRLEDQDDGFGKFIESNRGERP